MPESHHPLDILNLALALERLGGDAELLREIARLFLDDTPRLLADIQKAIAVRDAQALASAAHALKGSVANFGAETVLRAALRLEKMGSAGDMNDLDRAYAVLEAEMNRLKPALVALGNEAARE